jgi:hypothetical protein
VTLPFSTNIFDLYGRITVGIKEITATACKQVYFQQNKMQIFESRGIPKQLSGLLAPHG